MEEKIITDALGFTLTVTMVLGQVEVLGRHSTKEDHETRIVPPDAPHTIYLHHDLEGPQLIGVIAHEAYHLFFSVRHLITADEETQAEVFGVLRCSDCLFLFLFIRNLVFLRRLTI